MVSNLLINTQSNTGVYLSHINSTQEKVHTSVFQLNHTQLTHNVNIMAENKTQELQITGIYIRIFRVLQAGFVFLMEKSLGSGFHWSHVQRNHLPTNCPMMSVGLWSISAKPALQRRMVTLQLHLNTSSASATGVSVELDPHCGFYIVTGITEFEG